MNEFGLKVTVDSTCRLCGREPRRNGPHLGLAFTVAYRVEAVQAEQLATPARDRLQSTLRDPVLAHELLTLLGILHIDQIRLKTGTQHDGLLPTLLLLNRAHRTHVWVLCLGGTKFVLTHVAHDQLRFDGEQVEQTQLLPLVSCQPKCLHSSKSLQIAVQEVSKTICSTETQLDLSRIGGAFKASFCLLDERVQRLQIGQSQFTVDGVEVACRVHRPVHVLNLSVLKATDYVHDGARLPNVGEKLVAHAFPFAGTPYQTGDIHKGHLCRNGLARTGQCTESNQSMVDNTHLGGVWLDGTERIVRCFGKLTATQRVEE
mmetsp:Transcript_32829/g.82416  ORF Transcript_32829/g.82416 Transcript_32829/m.82416 type:complete len:317 (+) Transcript_32829:187-1137(+)